MIDLNQQEIKLIRNHLNKFLRYYETTQGEENFWEDTYKISELKIIRDKLKNAYIFLYLYKVQRPVWSLSWHE